MTGPSTGLRLALTGVENSHADHVLAAFNDDHRAGPHRIVALAAGEPDRTRDLARRHGVDAVVDRPEDRPDAYDGVIVCDRHGGRHAARALPFLRAGKPAWVDKPLACDPGEARELVTAARASGAGLFSCSAVRHTPDVEAVIDAVDRIGPIRGVGVSGPADPASEHGGIFFYGIHPIDVAVRIAALDAEPTVGEVAVRHRDDAVHAWASVGGVEVSATLIRPEADASTPFHVTVTGTTGVISREIVLGPHYLRPTVDRFIALLDRGERPISDAELLAPIDLLDRIAAAL